MHFLLRACHGASKEKSAHSGREGRGTCAVTSGQTRCNVATEHVIPDSTLSTVLKGKDGIMHTTSPGKPKELGKSR